MRVKDSLKEAIRSITGLRLRSALALIGVLVGIGTVITMVSIGEIVKEVSLAQFRELGTDIIHISFAPDAGHDPRSVKVEDFIDLAVESEAVESSAPWLTGGTGVGYLGRPLERVREPIAGVTGAFADLYKLTVKEGRFISRLDERKLYCVIGDRVARALRGMGAASVLGERIRVMGHLFEIIGVLEPKPNPSSHSRFRPDGTVFIPITTHRYLSPSRAIPPVTARIGQDVSVDAATRAVVAYFGTRTPGMAVSVRSPLELIEQMQAQGRLFTLLLAAIGSISLIMGGVGIMNVMLMSVTERRAEVGLRRALGARRRDIRRQFVFEAVTLCLVGGILGIALGIAASWAVCYFNGWPFGVSHTGLALGVAVSSGVGVLFGFLPAQQAARLDPIAALRE